MSRRIASGPASGTVLRCATARCAISLKWPSGQPAIREIVSMCSLPAPAAPSRPSRFRFILARREVLGGLFVAPAILYVLLLVGAPFLLAGHYSIRAYTTDHPS